MARRRPTRSDRLLRLLKELDQIAILTHDNPDPDAIASGWALLTLLREKLSKEARLMAGGAVVRAENVRMLEVLEPPIEFVELIEPVEELAYVLVDCTPTAANHLLGRTELNPAAVIDHHPPDGPRFRVRFRDIRPKRIATSSMLAQYLREQSLEPSTNLATALLYGIRTDALGQPPMPRIDHRIVNWLGGFVDFNKLAEIERAPLQRSYFADLTLALESTFCYGPAAVCFLPRASGPEIVGEVADLLIRCNGIEQVFCAAVVEHDALISTRTTDQGGDAARLLRKTIDGLGHSGGHAQRAGGKLLATEEKPARLGEDVQATLRNRWLAACNIDQSRGTRLVARKEIIENL